MIDTEALRKKVIDLAIQGKLTEQLPSDGDAETLYAQILDQKSQLIKEGKIKKDKELPNIAADEIPFEIPKNWKWVRLRDICKKIVDGDHNPPSGVKEKTEYLMLSAQNINNDRIENIEAARYLTKEVFVEENKRTNLEDGDVLLTIVATLGRSCVYREKYNVCFQRSVCVISTFIIPEYLKRFFDSGYIQKLMVDGATGAAQPGFYLNKVEKMCVPLPPLQEQKRIVDRIESAIIEIRHIDELQDKYNSDLEVLKSKIIDLGIRGKLTEQLPEDGDAETLYAQIQEEKEKLIKEGKIKKEKPLGDIEKDEIPFEIPVNWKWVRWGNIVNVVSARRVHQSDWRTEGIPFYRAREIAALADVGSVDNDLYISEKLYEEFSKFGVPHAGDLMVTGVGTLGKSYVVKENDRFYYKDASVLCFENYAVLEAEFLKRTMESTLMRSQIESNSGGTTVDTLTMIRMNQYLLPLPPLAEQKRIAERIDEIMAQLNQ